MRDRSLWSYRSEGSVLSICSRHSVLSSQADRAFRGRRADGRVPPGLVAAAVLVLLALQARRRR